jgi:hypothetical protein
MGKNKQDKFMWVQIHGGRTSRIKIYLWLLTVNIHDNRPLKKKKRRRRRSRKKKEEI